MKKLWSGLVVSSGLLIGCGSGGDNANSVNIPLVTPIVKSTAPKGLNGTRPTNALLSASDFKSRFFGGEGPTDVLGTLLPALDNLISGINTRTADSSSPCTSQAPVAFTITPFGQTVTLYAQCYEQQSPSYTGDPAFVQYGVREGVTYLYAAHGAEWIGAIVTPVAGAATQYRVQAWIGLGYANTSGCSSTWDGCSYASMELSADQSTGAFELAVAGIGIGYCGAQLKSDGSAIYAQGSGDMGTTCQASETLCVAASDATTVATCAAPLTTFTLPAIGRVSSASTAPIVVGNWGASLYPAGPNLTFNGTASDAIHFGPTAPTDGVGSLGKAEASGSTDTKK